MWSVIHKSDLTNKCKQISNRVNRFKKVTTKKTKKLVNCVYSAFIRRPNKTAVAYKSYGRKTAFAFPIWHCAQLAVDKCFTLHSYIHYLIYVLNLQL